MSKIYEESNIEDCRYTEQDVGKTFKKSKKKFIWEFTFQEKKHNVVLYDSKISGRKKVDADGEIQLPKQL